MKYEKILLDDRVSFCLKGIYIFCMEHKDQEYFTMKNVEYASPFKNSTVHGLMRDLEKLGYVERKRFQADTPNFMNSQWIFKDFDK